MTFKEAFREAMRREGVPAEQQERVLSHMALADPIGEKLANKATKEASEKVIALLRSLFDPAARKQAREALHRITQMN